MALTGKAAYAMYSQNVALPDVVTTLNREGFGNEDICMVLSPSHPVVSAVRDTHAPDLHTDESARRARIIGWFSKLGAVVIPTVGLFIRSQEFLKALLEEHSFPTLTGDSKTLAELGFSETEAKRLSREISDSGVLLYVSCLASDRVACATELLRRAGAWEAASLARATSVESNA